MTRSRRQSSLVVVAAAVVVAAVATSVVAAADGVYPGAEVIRFLEDRVARDPDDIVALNRLAGEYLRRFRETGDDADLDRSYRTAEQSLKAVPAEVNAGGLEARRGRRCRSTGSPPRGTTPGVSFNSTPASLIP